MLRKSGFVETNQAQDSTSRKSLYALGVIFSRQTANPALRVCTVLLGQRFRKAAATAHRMSTPRRKEALTGSGSPHRLRLLPVGSRVRWAGGGQGRAEEPVGSSPGGWRRACRQRRQLGGRPRLVCICTSAEEPSPSVPPSFPPSPFSAHTAAPTQSCTLAHTLADTLTDTVVTQSHTH